MSLSFRKKSQHDFKTRSELRDFVLDWARRLQTHQSSEPTAISETSRHLLLLQGQMGAGKTQIVNWIAEAFGAPPGASPTFGFHHRYDLNVNLKGSKVSTGATAAPGPHFLTLEHFDLDRVQSEEELESIGFWDVFANQAALVAIEWPERINWGHIPKDWPVTCFQIEKRGAGGDLDEFRRLVVLQT